jgi:hypothetical protein
MRLYRPKKDVAVNNGTVLATVFKGQLFFVDGQSDLPAHNDTPEALKEWWEEISITNHYGYIKIQAKE